MSLSALRTSSLLHDSRIAALGATSEKNLLSGRKLMHCSETGVMTSCVPISVEANGEATATQKV